MNASMNYLDGNAAAGCIHIVRALSRGVRFAGMYCYDLSTFANAYYSILAVSRT
jgi:hypothetical protein